MSRTRIRRERIRTAAGWLRSAQRAGVRLMDEPNTPTLYLETKSAPKGAFFVSGGEGRWRSGGFAEDAGSTRPPGADADGRRPAPERAASRGEAHESAE